MADSLGLPDLVNFTNTVRQSDPWGIASSSLGQFQPNVTTWSPTETGVTMFAKSFLQGLFGNIARADAANQLNSVVSVLPQLQRDPNSVGIPQGVDESAFNILKGTQIMNNAARQATVEDSLLGKGLPLSNDPSIPLSQRILQATGQLAATNKAGDIRGTLQGYGLLGDGSVAASPVATPTVAPAVVQAPRVITDESGNPVATAVNQPVQVPSQLAPGVPNPVAAAAALYPDSPQYKAKQQQFENAKALDMRATDARDYLKAQGAPYAEARENLDLMTQGFKESSPAVDIVYAVAANKILDPTSRVTASEVDNIQSIVPLLEKKIANFKQYVTPQGTINAQGKLALMNAVAPKLKAMEGNYGGLIKNELGRFQTLGGDPTAISYVPIRPFDLSTLGVDASGNATTIPAGLTATGRTSGGKPVYSDANGKLLTLD